MKKRREFLRGVTRSALLAAAGFGVVYGIRRKKITAEAQAACGVSSGCRNCGTLDVCSKEQAKELKGAGSREKGK